MYVETNAKIRRAFLGITCWKVVEWDSKRGIWTGPFFAVDSYVEGKKLKSDKRIEVMYGYVSHGLHTYADESDARNCLNYMIKYTPGWFRLVYCEIPRFSRFIVGTGENRMRCYVSEKLKVIKFV
jgi:hypothetical protein